MKYINIFINNFYVDLRSLAITRIAFGILFLTDLFIRSRHLGDFSTDQGFLAPHALKRIYEGNYYTSIHALSGDYYFQIALFLLAVVFGFLLIIGFFTRIATIVCWGLLVSLNLRNPFIIHGGDILFRCLLFWAIFTPWGERFSVDSYFRKYKINKNFIFSMGALAFIFQIMFMYIFTALLKTGEPWRVDYTAIYYALSIDHFSFLLGPYIYKFPALMKALTFSIYWAELLLPFLLLIPYRNSLFRYIFIGTFFIFHLGLALTMKIGLFPWFSMTAMLILLPPSFWDYFSLLQKWLEELFRRLSAGIEYYIDDFEGFFYYELRTPKFLKIGVSIIIAFLLIYVLFWNLHHSYEDNFNFVKNFKKIGRVTQLKQKWNMFAPNPYRSDGWYVIVGLLENGELVDVFRGGKEVSWEEPENRSQTFPSYRWRKATRNVYKEKNTKLRRYYARYVCNKWNGPGDRPGLKEIDMYFVSEYTLLDYKTRELKINHMYKYECRD